MEQRERLIKDLDGADVFLHNRANSLTAPLNEYDIEEMLDIAKICDEAARTLEKAIIPPCKVGDIAYQLIYTKKGYSHTLKETVVGIHIIDAPSIRGHIRENYIITHNENTNSVRHINFNKIGKTVFFSLEEVEREIAKRSAT